MNSEYEDYGYVSKPNRRTAQQREGEREMHHMFKRVAHAPDTNSLQRRKHELERKAIRKGR